MTHRNDYEPPFQNKSEENFLLFERIEQILCDNSGWMDVKDLQGQLLKKHVLDIAIDALLRFFRLNPHVFEFTTFEHASSVSMLDSQARRILMKVASWLAKKIPFSEIASRISPGGLFLLKRFATSRDQSIFIVSEENDFTIELSEHASEALWLCEIYNWMVSSEEHHDRTREKNEIRRLEEPLVKKDSCRFDQSKEIVAKVLLVEVKKNYMKGIILAGPFVGDSVYIMPSHLNVIAENTFISDLALVTCFRTHFSANQWRATDFEMISQPMSMCYRNNKTLLSPERRIRNHNWTPTDIASDWQEPSSFSPQSLFIPEHMSSINTDEQAELNVRKHLRPELCASSATERLIIKQLDLAYHQLSEKHCDVSLEMVADEIKLRRSVLASVKANNRSEYLFGDWVQPEEMLMQRPHLFIRSTTEDGVVNVKGDETIRMNIKKLLNALEVDSSIYSFQDILEIVLRGDAGEDLQRISFECEEKLLLLLRNLAPLIVYGNGVFRVNVVSVSDVILPETALRLSGECEVGEKSWPVSTADLFCSNLLSDCSATQPSVVPTTIF